jgi:hypothetical protein
VLALTYLSIPRCPEIRVRNPELRHWRPGTVTWKEHTYLLFQWTTLSNRLSNWGPNHKPCISSMGISPREAGRRREKMEI